MVQTCAFLLAVGLVFGLLTLLVRKPGPLWHAMADLLPRDHRHLALGLGSVVLALFGLALLAAVFVLWHSVQLAISGATDGVNLGSGALIAALLGAPFVIWGTILKHQTLRHQKEGHITDRISKAVEQLGAEKKVDRIGRPVTIWSGEADSFSCAEPMADRFLSRPRTTKTNREWKATWNHDTDEVEENYWVTITTYPQERTLIQWQGATIPLAADEVIGSEGEWKVFSESLPNIEVRLGAILSLERIAQDSTRHDNGRDHVRVMEILCAYIRENSPAPDLTPTEGAFSASPPRIDLQMAVSILGRRAKDQRLIEQKARYRLDLSRCNLDGMSFQGGSFEGAMFNGSRIEAANFWGADLTGALFRRTLLNFCIFTQADMLGIDLRYAKWTRHHDQGFIFPKSLAAYVEAADISGLTLTSGDAAHFFGSSDTTVSDDLIEEKKLAFKKMRQSFKRVEGKLRVEVAPDADIHDNEKPFLHWTPYTANDGASYDFREAFRDRHNLRGWPHED